MKKIVMNICFGAITCICGAQNVGLGTTTPNASALLDISSTTKGALVPRMTTAQKKAIVNPAAGLLIFDTDEKTLFMFDGQNWLGFAPLTNAQRPATNFVYGPDNLQDTTATGLSVSMWGQFAAVGAPLKKTNNIETGGVYIYRLVGGAWQFFVTLNPAGNNTASNFGVSVSLKGNYLVVGAPAQKNASNVTTGAAYAYTFDGTNWVLNQIIYGTSSLTNFGQAVATNQFGTYMAVSEPAATVAGFSTCGVVRVYNKPASTFILQQTLQDPAPAAGESFGSSLAISPVGLHIVVGAPSKTVSGFYSNGYVCQFDRGGSVWSLTHSMGTVGGEDQLGIGTNVDISDGQTAFTVGKYKQFYYYNTAWSSSASSVFTDPIQSISIDPTTDFYYVFAGNTLYSTTGGSTITKFKTLSADYINVLPQALSVYNKNVVAGIPFSQNAEHMYVGAVYFGLFP